MAGVEASDLGLNEGTPGKKELMSEIQVRSIEINK